AVPSATVTQYSINDLTGGTRPPVSRFETGQDTIEAPAAATWAVSRASIRHPWNRTVSGVSSPAASRTATVDWPKRASTSDRRSGVSRQCPVSRTGAGPAAATVAAAAAAAAAVAVAASDA